MTAATKTVSASPMGSNASLDALAGPAMAAMMLPSTLMLGGIVTMCGFGFAFARAFGVTPRDAMVPSPAAAAPRLVVSNPPPAAVAAVPVTVPAKPAPSKLPTAPSKMSRTGALPAKPKSTKAASAKDLPAAPKTVAVTAGGAEGPVAAASPAPARSAGIGAKPMGTAAVPATPKSPRVANPAAVKTAAPAKKLIPTSPKALTIATTSTAKGISLPKLSIQKTPGSEPGKD